MQPHYNYKTFHSAPHSAVTEPVYFYAFSKWNQRQTLCRYSGSPKKSVKLCPFLCIYITHSAWLRLLVHAIGTKDGPNSDKRVEHDKVELFASNYFTTRVPIALRTNDVDRSACHRNRSACSDKQGTAQWFIQLERCSVKSLLCLFERYGYWISQSDRSLRLLNLFLTRTRKKGFEIRGK
jgi:hypothetical protein